MGDAISPVTPRVQAISDSEDDWTSLPAIPPKSSNIPVIPPKPSSLSQPPVEMATAEEDDILFSLRPPLPVRTSRRSIQERSKSPEIRKKGKDSDDDFDWELFWKDDEKEEKDAPPLPSGPKPKLERNRFELQTERTKLASSDWSDEMPKIPLSLGQNQKKTTKRRQSFSSRNDSKVEKGRVPQTGARDVSKKAGAQSHPSLDDWSDDDLPVPKPTRRQSFVSHKELPVKQTGHIPPATQDWSDDELPMKQSTPIYATQDWSDDELPVPKKTDHVLPSKQDWSDDELPVKQTSRTPPSQREWSDDELPNPKQTRRQSLVIHNDKKPVHKPTTSLPKKSRSSAKVSVRQTRPLDDWSDNELPVKTQPQQALDNWSDEPPMKNTQSLDNWSEDSDLPAIKPTHPRPSQSDRRVLKSFKEISHRVREPMDWDPKRPQTVDDGLSAEEEMPRNNRNRYLDLEDESSSSDWPEEAHPTILKASPEDDVFNMFNGYDFSKQPSETMKTLSVGELLTLGTQEEISRNQVHTERFIEF